MRFYNKAHRFYCGIDLHAKTLYLCILDRDGQIVLQRNIKSRPEPFLAAIEPFREDLVVSAECVFTWYWLADLCRQEGIEFVLAHALYLRAIHGAKAKNDKIDAFKIASGDLTWDALITKVARTGKPIVISTGLSELFEIDRAIRTIENAGNNQIVILHCVSIYPPRDEQVNLNNIDTLRTLYPNYPIGFSDHTLGVSVPIASVVKGVCLLEKHFTLDKNMEGWDHKVSATPDEMALIVSETKRVAKALGTTRIQVQEKADRIQSFRRSIVSTRKIKAGEVIKKEDLDFKRPATGLPPEAFENTIGRTAKVDIEFDKPITSDQLI